MNTIIRKTVLLLTVIFIAGLFVMMVPAVSYGDGIVEDWRTEENDDSAINNTAPAEDNTYSEPITDYTPPPAENNNYSEPAVDYPAEPTDKKSVDYNVEVRVDDGVSGLNLRSNAGAGYDTVEDIVIPNGTVLHITKTARAGDGGLWGYTEYKGVKGWIYLGLTKKVDKPAKYAKKAVIPSEAISADYNVVVRTSGRGMYIRSGPGDRYDKLRNKVIPNGTVLHISKITLAKNGRMGFRIWRLLRVVHIQRAENGALWGYTEYKEWKGWVYLRNRTVITTAPATYAAPVQTKTEKETKKELESDDDDKDDEPAAEQSSNSNSDVYFMMNMFIIFMIVLVILALIVILVVLLTRRNDRR